MKLRLDLLKFATPKDTLEGGAGDRAHRYKPEPLFSKTGTGSLSSASTEEPANEVARSTARIQKAEATCREAVGRKSKIPKT